MEKTKIMFPYVRHLHCQRCEDANRPFKKQKGITLHLVRLLRIERDTVYIEAVCILCSVRPAKNPYQVSILRKKTLSMPIKEWNALVKMNPRNDGFYD